MGPRWRPVDRQPRWRRRQEEGRGKDGGIPYFKTIDRNLKPVTLTDDQKSKLEDLKKEYEPKLKEAYAKEDVLTPEQKKAGEEAKKAAKAAGKKGKEVKDAVAAAVKETDDQKKQEKDARKCFVPWKRNCTERSWTC